MRSAENVALADEAAIEHAATILRAGGLVAFPTETVYGLGADATSDSAAAAIFEAKGRPRFNPLIVHVLNTAAAENLAVFSAPAKELAQRFWPGPLTLVLPRKETSGLSLLVSAGLDTVAVRSPAHSVARRLLEAADIPIAAPSANRSGQVSPTTAEHVAADFGERIDLVLDGGPTTAGIESTVIGFENGTPVLLRPGAIPRAEIEQVTGTIGGPSIRILSSPGQLASHYAPRTPLRLNACEASEDEALLAFGPKKMRSGRLSKNLSRSGDLKEAAANLFAMLRELDRTGMARIAVMPIPEAGLGEAINDRLRRAAAPRGKPCA